MLVGAGAILDIPARDMTRPGQVEPILGLLTGERLGVMLYGSCARGDASASSDIDVLQLVTRWRPSYTIGRISVSAYTAEHLHALARAGSLFVLHLVREGKVMEDPGGHLATILSAYRAPTDYVKVRCNLARALSVLDVGPSVFHANPRGFLRVAFYLLRTALYVRCAELGTPVFAIAEVARRLEAPWIVEVFARRATGGLELFQDIKQYLRRELDADGRNEYGTLESLAVALSQQCPIASSLALRLLDGDENIDYDATMLDWSHEM